MKTPKSIKYLLFLLAFAILSAACGGAKESNNSSSKTAHRTFQILQMQTLHQTQQLRRNPTK